MDPRRIGAALPEPERPVTIGTDDNRAFSQPWTRRSANERRGKRRSWIKRRDAFHPRQAKVRAGIRIKEGRAKPIDLIAQNVFAETYMEFDAFVNPLTVLKGLTLNELEETKTELEELRELDTQDAKRRQFWTSLIGVTEMELDEVRKNEEIERSRVRGQNSERTEATSLHADIDDDVVEIVERQVRG